MMGPGFAEKVGRVTMRWIMVVLIATGLIAFALGAAL